MAEKQVNMTITPNKKLYTYTQPSKGATKSVSLNTDGQYKVSKVDGNWGYIPNIQSWVNLGDQYSNVKYSTDGTAPKAKEISNSDATGSNQNSASGDSNSSEQQELKSYEPDPDSYGGFSESSSNGFSFKEIKGIFGLPYAYLDTVDRKLEGMYYGRRYAEKILTTAPLLFLTPGKPKFMSGYSAEYKQRLVTKMAEVASGSGGGESVEDLIGDGKDGKYYDFEFAFAEYYHYVNTMCQNAARFLGIGKEKFCGTPLQSFDWSKYNAMTDQMSFLASGKEYICFYIESENQISLDFSNSTGESMLSSGFNQMSDYGNEIRFVLGTAASYELEKISDGVETSLQSINDFAAKYSNPNGIVNKLRTAATTLAVGGKMIFPEIWKDSEYSPSYSANIKLISPDQDNFSIFINILVPMYHLLALTLPRALGANGYYSPFLVRGFYKGYYNWDMGMITGMTINKGGEGLWNDNGLPTQMEINLSIKDMYKTLAMTPQSGAEGGIPQFLRNTPFVDFIANSVGININKPAILRTMSMGASIFGSNVVNAPSRIWTDAQQFLLNKASKLKILH